MFRRYAPRTRMPKLYLPVDPLENLSVDPPADWTACPLAERFFACKTLHKFYVI
jgi:hypothetical protein